MSDTGNPTDGVSRRTMIGSTATGMAALLAGCIGGDGSSGSSDGGDGDGGDGGDGETTTTSTQSDTALEVLHAWTGGDGAAAVEELTSQFTEEYPDMNTNFRPIGGTGNVNLNSVIARRLSNNNPPSSFQAWPGENIRQYEGILANITSVWTDNGYVEKMNDTAAELCQQGGDYRSMPLGSHRMNNLFYNVSVLEEAGVDPDSLTDMDSLISAMDAIQENTDAVPMTHAMKAPWTNLQLWVEVMLSQEGEQAYMDFINGEGDQAAVKRSLETTQEVIENYINDDASTISFTEANQKLINGEAAFIHQGNWAYGMYRAEDSGIEYQEDWDWVAFPGTEDMYVLHIDAFTFPADAPAPTKRDTWAKFLGTKDAQVGFGNNKGSVPLRMDVDGSRLTDFLEMTYNHLTEKPKQPPTLAHGLAVSPEALGNCKSAIGDNFMGPFDAEATASALMDAVSE